MKREGRRGNLNIRASKQSRGKKVPAKHTGHSLPLFQTKMLRLRRKRGGNPKKAPSENGVSRKKIKKTCKEGYK